jgi:DNA-binding transcriptional LysR family regulator
MENLNDILVFVRVVEKGSFSTAAKELGLSAAAVSRHINQLELSLGVQLLKRSTRHLTVTDAGADFYKRCRELVLGLEQARNVAMAYSTELKGLLRVHATLGVGQRLVAPAVNAFLQEYTELSVELTIGTEPVNLLERGLDVVIRSAYLSDSSLSCRELGGVHYSICASRAYLEKHGTPRTPQDLTQFNCIIHTGQPAPNEWLFTTAEGRETVVVSGSLRTNNGVALYEAVRGGLGIARLPDYAVADDVKSGDLVVLFSEVRGWGRGIKAFYPRSQHQPAKLTAFLDFMEDFMKRRAEPLLANLAG